MNDCYFEKKDWRACSKEVSEDLRPREIFSPKVLGARASLQMIYGCVISMDTVLSAIIDASF